MSDIAPRPLDFTHLELAEKHVIVSLQGPVRDFVPRLPFHTTGLEWDVGRVPDGEGQTLGTEELEAIYRQIATQVTDLMELLRGKDAP
jgi:hypothetical protein